MTNMDFALISTDRAGAPAVPSSQGAAFGGFVFTSGHGPRRPGDAGIETGDLRAQLTQTVRNIEAVLQEGGSDLAHCVRILVLLRDRSLIAEFNEIYAELIPQPYPPRMTMIAELVHPDILVEMHAIGAVVSPAQHSDENV